MIDHLWQSTLCAAAIALVVPLFAKQSAALRFWLWFSASAKFLFPFSLLIWLGGFLPSLPGPAPLLAAKSLVTTPAMPDQMMPDAPVLGLMWIVGALFLTVHWLVRWRNLRALLRDAPDLGLTAPVPVKQVPSFLEPALVGIWRPVILMPRGIAEQLSPCELRAIIAHELSHLHRRDNLLALVQLLVQALFWFHPLVWWIGARLVAERERACDERVLETGTVPATYAESILKVCRFRLQPALACTAGVSGGNLLARVEAIMANRVTAAADGSRILLLALLAAVTALVPLLAGAPGSTPVNRLARQVASVLQTPQLAAMPQIGSPLPPPLPRLLQPRAVNVAPPAIIIAAAPVLESAPVPQSVAPRKIVISTTVSADMPRLDVDDRMVCRRQSRSDTRLLAPPVCMTASAWAQMQSRGEGFGPDGQTIVAVNSFEMSRSLNPPACVGMGGGGCAVSAIQISPRPVR